MGSNKNGNKGLSKKMELGHSEQEYVTNLCVEEKIRKNEMKVRATLLMALLNKDQLKFHTYQDAKLLMEAIEKRYGGNKESKKVQRTLLKQQYENFAALSSESIDQTFDSYEKRITYHASMIENKAEIETISLDDLYNNLKIYEPELTAVEAQTTAIASTSNPNNLTGTPTVKTGNYKEFISCKPFCFNGTEGSVHSRLHVRRFQELAFLCPNMVPNPEKLMEAFIGGLPQSIEGNVTASKPQTLEEATNIAHRLMDQIIKRNSVQETNDHKRS
ncbi:hypothetical protein Tco_0631265 [Tanacetum coccineum]